MGSGLDEQKRPPPFPQSRRSTYNASMRFSLKQLLLATTLVSVIAGGLSSLYRLGLLAPAARLRCGSSLSLLARSRLSSA